MDVNRIIDTFYSSKIGTNCTPNVFLFDDNTEGKYNEVIEILRSENYELLDINQYVTIETENYSISLSEAGFVGDQSDELTINDLVCDEKRKEKQIYKVKLNRLEEIVSNKTVLLIRYNDMFIKGDYLYEMIRSWLKDGYVFHNHFSDICLNALVFAETDENLRDFCPYGERVK